MVLLGREAITVIMSEAGTRYAVITPDNQSANIYVCGIISLALGTACVIGRGLFRYRLGFAFSTDDWVFFASWVSMPCRSPKPILTLRHAGRSNHRSRLAVESYGNGTRSEQ